MTAEEMKLLKAFPNSFINNNSEFIASNTGNQYFRLEDCKEGTLDIRRKVVSWFSRGACKTEPYRSKKKIDEFHKFMLDGINKFLGTEFTNENMELIYTRLGNDCNKELCEKFITSGYDMNILEDN